MVPLLLTLNGISCAVSRLFCALLCVEAHCFASRNAKFLPSSSVAFCFFLLGKGKSGILAIAAAWLVLDRPILLDLGNRRPIIKPAFSFIVLFRRRFK